MTALDDMEEDGFIRTAKELRRERRSVEAIRTASAAVATLESLYYKNVSLYGLDRLRTALGRAEVGIFVRGRTVRWYVDFDRTIGRPRKAHLAYPTFAAIDDEEADFYQYLRAPLGKTWGSTPVSSRYRIVHQQVTPGDIVSHIDEVKKFEVSLADGGAGWLRC